MLCLDRKRALVAGDAYPGRWARCDCNFPGRVVSFGLGVWITHRWVVASTTCMRGHLWPQGSDCGRPLDHGHRGSTMRLLRGR